MCSENGSEALNPRLCLHKALQDMLNDYLTAVAATASERKQDIWTKCGGRAIARCPDDKVSALQALTVEQMRVAKVDVAKLKTTCAGQPGSDVYGNLNNSEINSA